MSYITFLINNLEVYFMTIYYSYDIIILCEIVKNRHTKKLYYYVLYHMHNKGGVVGPGVEMNFKFLNFDRNTYLFYKARETFITVA